MAIDIAIDIDIDIEHMYAILDIETTGGQFNEEGITEIAIYKFDGHEVTDQFISLINPEIPIQPFVVKLTGISNAMLRSAPKFFEVAKRIIEMTQDSVLVAHNASFDYRILRTEFRRLGYNFEVKTLCTVELAQKLLPEQPSHSLGKLVRALGIPMADRHRASGDAMATVKLFKLLLAKDVEKLIVKELIKTEVEKGISPKLLDIIDNLPSKTGIYYIHREDGTVIFIGQSKNIKKRVNQHFIGTSSKCKKIQAEVFAVTYEETGSELIALLKEMDEIKINKPVYSKPYARSPYRWAITSKTDASGYLNLVLEKFDRRKHSILEFSSLSEAKSLLMRVTAEYNLCQKLNGLTESESDLEPNDHGNCDGACIGQVTPDDYNLRVTSLIETITYGNKNIVLIDRGRSINERSAIVFENGIFKGYAFYDLNYQIHNIDILRRILIPMEDTRESRNIIQSFIRKGKRLKIIEL